MKLMISLMFMLSASITLMAQEKIINKDGSLFTKGSVMSSFSADWIDASRDEFNHEFEKSVKQLQLQLDLKYFVSPHIAIGPSLSYSYTGREYGLDPDISFFGDLQEWSIQYGIEGGYYYPVKEYRIFLTGGIGLRSDPFKYKTANSKLNDNFNPIYELSTGFIIPLGNKIGLQGHITRNSQQLDFNSGYFNGSQEFIRTGEFTKWSSTLSSGLGIVIRF